jgi:phenylacetate-CoA ligase
MKRASEQQYFDADVETMPRAQIERLQEARILKLVPYAYRRSALVRAVWDEAGVTPADIGSLADFKARVPFIDKETIRRFRDRHGDPFGGLVCARPPHLRGVGFTSGTTGDPTPLPRSEVHVALASLQRELWHIGVRPGDYFAHVLFTFREGLMSDRFMESGMRPVAVQHTPADMPWLIELSRQCRPRAMFMLSTPLVIALDQYQRRTGDDLREAFSSYRGVVFGGEPMSPSLRAIVDGWGLEVFELSSLGDVCTTMECRAHDGMHTWEDLSLVEHLEPGGGRPAADGERGELVVTALLGDVAPLIRFRTDDLVRFTRAPCGCGRTHGRLWPVGRKGDEMLIGGRSVLPVDIFPLMQQFPETHAGLFQLVRARREADTLELRVGYDPAALRCTLAELAGRLGHALGSALGVPVAVALLPDEELLRNGPPNKIARVVKPL